MPVAYQGFSVSVGSFRALEALNPKPNTGGFGVKGLGIRLQSDSYNGLSQGFGSTKNKSGSGFKVSGLGFRV